MVTLEPALTSHLSPLTAADSTRHPHLDDITNTIHALRFDTPSQGKTLSLNNNP